MLDVADAAHVRGQIVHLSPSRTTHGGLALLPPAEVEQLELVGDRRSELGILEIDATHPYPSALRARDQVMADESTGTGHDGASRLCSH